MTTTNYAATIPHHANHIWDALHAVSTHSTDTYAWVAADLERAETAADSGLFSDAVGHVISAARQVFGCYSDQYAELISFYSA
jgi:hypothetical protein